MVPSRVLVTGAAGFVGHHIVDYLLKRTEAHVVFLDRLDTSGNLGRLAEVIAQDSSYPARTTSVWHDLKAPIGDLVEAQIGDVDCILHLAAGSHVDRSIAYPMEFVQDNVVGTCNLLDFARKKDSLKSLFYFSTDEVFGPAPEGVFYKEEDRYNPGNPYASTKAGAEELCVAYANTYDFPVIITHCMNIIGIRQHPEKFVPLVMNKVLDGERVYIHSDESLTKAGTRWYISASDVAEAVLHLIEVGQPGQKYNIIGQREIDNRDLALMIADEMGKALDYEMVNFSASRPGWDFRYALDGSKLEKLGWSPRIPVEDEIRHIVRWTLKNPQWLGR